MEMEISFPRIFRGGELRHPLQLVGQIDKFVRFHRDSSLGL